MVDNMAPVERSGGGSAGWGLVAALLPPLVLLVVQRWWAGSLLTDVTANYHLLVLAAGLVGLLFVLWDVLSGKDEQADSMFSARPEPASPQPVEKPSTPSRPGHTGADRSPQQVAAVRSIGRRLDQTGRQTAIAGVATQGTAAQFVAQQTPPRAGQPSSPPPATTSSTPQRTAPQATATSPSPLATPQQCQQQSPQQQLSQQQHSPCQQRSPQSPPLQQQQQQLASPSRLPTAAATGEASRCAAAVLASQGASPAEVLKADPLAPGQAASNPLARSAPTTGATAPLVAQAATSNELVLAAAKAGVSVVTETGEEKGIAVFLHVYDVSLEPGIQQLNQVLAHRFSPFKFGGIFHAGVEVDGREWSFGYCERGTGVGCTEPKKHSMHHYRETVELPPTKLSMKEIAGILRTMAEEYPGQGYHLVRRNCCTFAADFCRRLGVGEIPTWVHRLALLGDSLLHASQGLEKHVLTARFSRSVAEGVGQLESLNVRF